MINNKSFKLSGIYFTGGSPDFMGGLGLFAGLVGRTGLAHRVSLDQVFNSRLAAGGYPCSDPHCIKLQTTS